MNKKQHIIALFATVAVTTSAQAANPASKAYVDQQVQTLQSQITNIDSGISSAPRVGQAKHGGVIFFVNQTGQGGLVVAESDEPGTHSRDQAIAACLAKTTNGFTDWYLPTRAELSLLWTNRFAVEPTDPNGNGGFTILDSQSHWSSSLDPRDNATMVQNFYNGTQVDDIGVQPHVRCIRTFTEAT